MRKQAERIEVYDRAGSGFGFGVYDSVEDAERFIFRYNLPTEKPFARADLAIRKRGNNGMYYYYSHDGAWRDYDGEEESGK